MKYVLMAIFFFISIFLFLNYYLEIPDDGILVMSYDNSNEYQVYTIYTNNLTTKNFNKYFFNITSFLAIYPKINPIYKNRLGDVMFSCENACDLEKFTNYYRDLLEKNHFQNDITNIDYYGISIEKVKIYTNKENLMKILNNCSICTMKES